MRKLRPVVGLMAVLVTVAAMGVVGVVIPSVAQAATAGSQTFAYSASTQAFTVPAGVTQLTVTALGGEGGLGGADSSGNSFPGGYRGQVSGTIAVVPGQVVTIGVGHGGTNGTNTATGPDNSSLSTAAAGGTNPLGGYGGGNGGIAGWQGNSGDAGGGGAATVVEVGGSTIVAGGSGGAGGSGQYAPTRGRAPYSTFTPAPGTTTSGQVGITIFNVCNNAASPGCDGGGGGPGGGGAQGGAQGAAEFGSGTSDEWFGYGGYPGSNSTGGISTLSAAYAPYADDAASGSVVFSWNAGAPNAPTNVAGAPGDQSVGLTWTAPTNGGGSAITDYMVQYALASSPTSWITVDTGSAGTSSTISGLTNSTGYIFQVAAVNGTGEGAFSTSSGTVTPIGPPPAPVISAITPADGALSVAFSQSAPAGSATVIGYEFSLDGGATWVSAGVTVSPLTVPGLTNGTQYSVEIRAVSSVGDTAASAPMAATPASVPGAPTIVSISTSPEAASVSFSPGYAGGGAVTGYEYQLNNGAWVSGGSSSPIAITGLADGATYSVAIRTDSSSGTSAASVPSSFTTPSVPGAPTATVTPGDSQLSIAYAPGSPGGSTITGYEYSLDGGSTWTSANASPIVVTGLTNGTTYSVSVRADNVIGVGVDSTPQSAAPATVPSAPTISSNNVAGSGQLSVSFTAPLSNGGAAITNYQYSTDAGATWRAFSPAVSASPAVISTLSSDGTTSLTNTTYPIEVRAVNSVGDGVASATNDGTAATVPAAPTLAEVTTGSGSLQVAFTSPANGGSPIIEYEYTLDGTLWQSTGTLGSTFTITGLTNGTSYPVQVQAVNTLGDSSPSNVISATPSTTPAQPTITGVVRSAQTLTVSVSDASNGGATITDYQYSTDGGATWHTSGSSSSPLTITTLSTNGTTPIANGTSYPIEVRAMNAAGVSVASTTTNVGPAAAPSAPVMSLTPSDQAAGVTFSILNDGGSPISGIEYELNSSGSWINAGTLSSPFTISGLTNGTTYTVNVRADNAIGTGTASNPATVTPYTVPGAPTTVVAISDSASADVSWTAPASIGGSAITGYTATAYTEPAAGSPVGTACVTPAGTTSCTITGLTNGTTFYVSVVANNLAGAGLPSSPRNLVIPLARPAAPTLGSITAGDSTLSVPFSFPTGYLNGAALVSYQYQLNGGAWVTMSATTSPLQVTGLSDGTSYTIAVRAVSVAGDGAASTISTAATPFTFPTAPNATTIVTTGENGALLVSWAAPNNNGSPITSYTATAFTALTAGGQVNTCTPSPIASVLSCTISGLSNGTTYYVSLQATNAAGASVRSDPRVAGTPAAVPSAPAAPSPTAGDTQVSLTWAAPSNNGSTITDYDVYSSSDGTNWTLFNDGVSTATSATVTGLANGTGYTFEVAAVNANGTGPMSPASTAVTPVGAGVTPALSSATPTDTGFTFTITNYDPGTAYTYAFSPTGPSASRSGNTVTVTGLALGASSTVTVTATQVGHIVETAPITGTALTTIAQAISFTGPADTDLAAGTVTLTATADSALPVAFTSATTAVCTVSGTTVTLLATGVCTIDADQAGDGTYAPAPTIVRSLNVTSTGGGTSSTPQTISFTGPADTDVTAGPVTVTATSDSALPVAFTSATTAVCTVSGTTVTLLAAGVCTIDADQAGDGTYAAAPTIVRSFNVTTTGGGSSSTPQTISFTGPADTGVATGSVTLTASADSALPVAFTSSTTTVCTVSGTTVTLLAAGICTVDADQAGDSTYAAASTVTQSFNVIATAQAITFAQPVGVDVSTGTLTLSATADSGLAIIYSSATTAVCTVSGSTVTLLATGTCTINADQPGNGSYAAATTLPRSFIVTGTAGNGGGSTGNGGGSAGTTVPAATTTRIGGADRDATAADLAVVMYPTAGSARAVVLARDDVYADGLTGSPLANAVDGPLLLTATSTLSAATTAAIERVLPAGGTVICLGGDSAISPEVLTDLQNLGYQVQRIGGADRYATATLIANKIGSITAVTQIYLATGQNFADALPAADAAGLTHGVVLLTANTIMPGVSATWMNTHSWLSATAVGGSAATADPAATAIVGSDRYATAAQVANTVGSTTTGIVLATGIDFPDGLAGAAYAVHNGWSLLLLNPTATTLNPTQANYLHTAQPTVTTVTAIGGTTALPDATTNLVNIGLN